MRRSSHEYIGDVMSGRERGLPATVLRGAMALAEPFYAGVIRARNWLFDRRLRRTRVAPRPVICVGNLTTGGTGKTPLVRWLADELRRRGERPAVLMRGYKSSRSSGSDEQRLLEELLSDPSLAPVPVVADPDRLRGAHRAIELDGRITLLLLDDGFQHRRLRRDFDLVLIDATNPFGHHHLLPRGLLREPPGALGRAHAILLTRVEAATAEDLAHIEATVRRHNAFAPLYRCRHVHDALINSGEQRQPVNLTNHRYLAFCGIGNPGSFLRQLTAAGGQCVGTRLFGDHHSYSEQDLEELSRLATARGADLMLTTGKDWVKLRRLKGAAGARPPIWRAQLRLEFEAGDDQRLLEQILAIVHSPGPA